MALPRLTSVRTLFTLCGDPSNRSSSERAGFLPQVEQETEGTAHVAIAALGLQLASSLIRVRDVELVSEAWSTPL